MNYNAQAYNQYKKSTVETVSPEKLLIMLYDGALKDINNAKKAIEEKDINRAHNEIMKTEEIIVELMSTLNMDYEISGKLFVLYEYLYYQLTQANAKKDIKLLNEVEGFLLELRETWQEAIKINKTAAPVAAADPVGQTAAPAPVAKTNQAAPPKQPAPPGSMSAGLNIRG